MTEPTSPTRSEPTTNEPIPGNRALIVRPRRGLFARLTSLGGPLTLALLSLAGLAALWMIGGFLLDARGESVLASLEEDVERGERLANARIRTDALRQAELVEREARVVAETKLAAALDRLERAEAAVSDFAERHRVVRAEFTSMLEGSTGRRIAGDEALLARAENLQVALDSPAGELPGELRQRLSRLSAPLREAERDLPADYAPGQALVASLDEIHAEAVRRTRTLADLDAVLKFLSREAGGLPAADRTLAEVLSQRRRTRAEADAAEQAGKLAAARKQQADALTVTRIAAEDKIAEATRVAAKLVGEQKAEAIRIAAEREAADLAAENERKRIAAEKAALEAAFARDRAAVAHHLTAFTADGDKYRGRNAPAAKGPASLAALRGAGALDDSEYGLRQMLFVLHPGNNRRSGLDWVTLVMHLPPSGWSDGQRSHVQEAQRLLREYGDLMVEKGMLDP